MKRSFEDDEYNEDEIVLTSFELEYEIEIQKRFKQLQKIFADKKAELARIAQAGFQVIINLLMFAVCHRPVRIHRIYTLKTLISLFLKLMTFNPRLFQKQVPTPHKQCQYNIHYQNKQE